MGQYQQWLLYQETDQRLRAQLKPLKTEQAQLREQVRLLEQACPQSGNVIIQILLESLTGANVEPVEAEYPQGVPMVLQGIPFSALDWDESLYTPEPLPNGDAPLPAETPARSEMVILPEEAEQMLDENGHTDPRHKVHWWLHDIMSSSGITSPIDQETIRTDRLILRWIERWGRQTAAPNAHQEDGPV